MKRFFAVILASVLLCSTSFPAFAGRVATSSNASRPYRLTAEPWKGVNPDYSDDVLFQGSMLASRSNASYMDIMPLDSNLPTILNTVSWMGLSMELVYYDVSGALKTQMLPFSSSQYCSFNKPSDFGSLHHFGIVMNSDSLPSSGTYDVSVRFASNTGVVYQDFRWYTLRQDKNVNYVESVSDSVPFQQFSGDFLVRSTLEFGNINYLVANIYPAQTDASIFPYGGFVNINFTESTNQPDFIGSGGLPSSDDVQGDIADNTGQLVEQQEQTNNFLVQIIQTISNQLAAFWNQLAGEFTNLYNMMDSQHNEQLDNDNANAELIVDSANENTNTITNGFDNSQMESNSSILEDSMNEMDSAESEILDSVSGNLKDFEFPSIDLLPSGVLAALMFFGNQMQLWFEGMGHMNFPITLSLTLIFALMLVGYHRFRS